MKKQLHLALRAGGFLTGMLALSACASYSTTNSDVAYVEPGATSEQQNIDRAFFSADRIKADVTFLSQDLLRGRDTGSEGHRIAAHYVAAEFARLGVAPMGDNGGYFQEVPMRKAKVNVDTAAMTVRNGDETLELELGDDFFMSGSVKNPSGEVSADVVFVGYGVHAPDLGHDDLAGLDLSGKIVVALSGAPSTFNTEIRAHHGSGATKLKAIEERGAVGIITFNSASDEKRRPFASFKRFLGRESFDWIAPDSDASEAGSVKATAAISHDVARKLFAGSSSSLDDVLAQADTGKVDGFDLTANVTMKRESILTDPFDTPNVVAVLEGSDANLKSEYVVLSAHLDHIGVSENAKGDDKINNGALDNASGVSTLLEVARAYVAGGERPKRSILFTIVTGEERGLLGAEYFAHYPTVEKPAIVANVNLDMPLLLYDFTDVVAFGAERSSLGPITEAALAKLDVALSPDPIPQEGIFTRSDHYRFVQQGVPSVFLMTGWNKGLGGKDGGKIFQQFLSKTYHSPADDITQDIDFDAGAKFAYANWLIASDIANAPKRPTWNEGDFFGRTFAGSRKK
ncbi:M28 family metallopeptidase [Kordiimonas aquimaris]|uniref:M28 family metallopeptidase n=1 Tax=Kordiimonas aquimaris TaxID=707591 RepID=UPI0021D22938|nr:M28 family metallopeptidase [Kordiimonas aquimaris]